MSRKVQCLEANFILTIWPKFGEAGEIRDADRRIMPTAQTLGEVLAHRLMQEINNAWHSDLQGSDADNLPVKLVFNAVIERKEYRNYGK